MSGGAHTVDLVIPTFHRAQVITARSPDPSVVSQAGLGLVPLTRSIRSRPFQNSNWRSDCCRLVQHLDIVDQTLAGPSTRPAIDRG